MTETERRLYNLERAFLAYTALISEYIPPAANEATVRMLNDYFDSIGDPIPNPTGFIHPDGAVVTRL